MIQEMDSPIFFIINTTKKGVAIFIANTQAELNTSNFLKLPSRSGLCKTVSILPVVTLPNGSDVFRQEQSAEDTGYTTANK